VYQDAAGIFHHLGRQWLENAPKSAPGRLNTPSIEYWRLSTLIRQPANVHTNDMLDVLDVVPLEAGDMMLFCDEVVPVRAGARKDNLGEGIIGHYFAVCCTQDGNIGSWLRDMHFRSLLSG
jgi:hypothetical protein